ncbi:MAG: hypothetical protein Q9222_005111 [Ikaeria aurantiellina]
MDPLGATASVCSILDAISKIIQYSSLVKNARKETAKLIEELCALRKIFEDFLRLLNQTEDALGPGSPGRLDTLRRLAEPDNEWSTLASCQESLNKLLAGLERSQCDSKASKSSAVITRLSWPFREKEILKTIERFEKLKSRLEAGLNIDQARLAQEIHVTVRRVDERTSVYEKIASQDKIYQWLSAPDPSINHNAARDKFHRSTGEWFLRGQQYASWKVNPNSIFWLHGMTGCGKTILASTIIDDLSGHCKQDGCALAYYYFDFSNSNQQDYGLMLRSLLKQLARQLLTSTTLLDELYGSSKDGQQQPSDEAMLAVLKRVTQCFSSTHIVLDALDECKSTSKLLKFVRAVHDWSCDGIHLLATSQRQGDIVQTLSLLVREEYITDIKSSLIMDDISRYIRGRLSNDENLKRWRKEPALLDKIESKLLEKADGM